ncbi:MAG: polymer-forming cytoskeletal protein [Gammaproteobacteria bacterium]
MFSKPTRNSREIRTLVGAGTRVNGDVIFSDGLHVDGVVHGNVAIADGASGTLSISRDGVIEGNVSVSEAVVEGTVKGNVEVTERVKLGATARVVGDVVYELVEMASGAEVNGKLIHKPAAAGGRAKKASPAKKTSEAGSGDAAADASKDSA